MCVQQESAASLMILSIRYLDSTTQRFSLSITSRPEAMSMTLA